MKNAGVLLPALLSAILVFSLVLPASVVGGSSGLADSPWPKFRHNPQNTGRGSYPGPGVPVLKWSFTTGHDVMSSPAIGADGTMYVGSYHGNLEGINPDGTEKWSFTTNGAVPSSPAIGADGTIYVGSYDKKLYAVDPDGTKKWSFTTGDSG